MNYLQRLIQEVRIVLFVTLLINNILLFGVWYVAKEVWNQPFSVIVAILLFGSLLLNFIFAAGVGSVVTQPLKLLWRNILHVSPSAHGAASVSRFTTLWLGKDLVAALTDQVHQIAMITNDIEEANAQALPDLHKNFIANSLPLPLIVLDKDETIIFANIAALRYFDVKETEFVGSSLRHKINMTFSQADKEDLDTWLASAKSGSATASQTWDEVNISRGDDLEPLQFDLAAFYNKDNPKGIETMLVYFDHSARYTKEDQDVGFIALAVHELRTPITMLRGYIEVLDEELSSNLDGATRDYFNKLKVSSEQLASFLNNILKVASIEGNQLEVQLQEEKWDDVIKQAAESLRLRAEIRGLQLECDIENNLPTVGVDRFSIIEVLTNLVDNAIKYSAGKGQKIVIRSRLIDDGQIVTTVEDAGVGIAQSVIPTLFNKFQRNFHNRASVSGTGLGLYLSKVIVNLHGGNIWVSSKEGKGTTVGFTVKSYASLSDELKAGPSTEIIRGSHGWIKNHYMSRR